MPDYGHVYFFNMTNQTLNIYVNAGNPLVINPLSVKDIKKQADTEKEKEKEEKGIKHYHFSFKAVERNGDPASLDGKVFGLTNKIVYWLANETTWKKQVEIEIDQTKPAFHLDADFLIYIFYDSVVMSVDGNAFVYPSGEFTESSG